MQLEQIQKLSIEQLLDSKILDSIEEFSQDAMFDEPKEAQEYFYVLHDLMNKYKDDFSRNPEVFRKYLKIVMTMFWKGLQAIEDSLKKVYMGKYLVFSLVLGIDPIPKLRRCLDLFEHGFVPDMALRANLIFYLMENEEKIGREMIELKTGEKIASIVKNWLKDYISSLPDNKNVQGGFDKVSYLTNNQNVQKLNPQEKELLSKVIDVYRFLKTPVRTEQAPVVRQTRPIPAKGSARPINQIPPAPAKPATAFGQKLAEAAKPSSVHGQTLETLKHNLEERGVVKLIEPAATVKTTPPEIKREVKTPELPSPDRSPRASETLASPKPPLANAVIPKPVPTSANRVPLTPHSSTLIPISVIDDLKKIDVSYLRAGPLQSQITNLKSSILNLAHANKVLPYFTVNAFEQSPLFKSYLAHGSSKFGGGGDAGTLTQQEFEAIADLRKELERL